MQSSCIGMCKKNIQLFNTFFFIIFIHILFFKLALSNRCANFAVSPLGYIYLEIIKPYKTVSDMIISKKKFHENKASSTRKQQKNQQSCISSPLYTNIQYKSFKSKMHYEVSRLFSFVICC